MMLLRHIVINRWPIIILKTLVNISWVHTHVSILIHGRWIELVHLWLLMLHGISHLIRVCLVHSHVNLSIWRHWLLTHILNNTLWRVKVIVHHLVLSLKVLIRLLHHLVWHVHLLMLSILSIRIMLILSIHLFLAFLIVILHEIRI